MKKNYFFIVIAGLTLLLSACSSTGSDLIDPTANYPKTPGAFVKSRFLTGALKGTLKQDSTYYLVGSVAVNAGDTLAVQPGATIIANGNYQIQISGNFLSLGTEAKPVTFTSADASRFTDFATYTGHWGGFLCDSSAHYVYMRYTHVNFTGGPDTGGGAQATFDFEASSSVFSMSKNVSLVIEDCWFYGGIDDGIHLNGNMLASIKRNVIQRLGGPDGESMNIKSGVKGDISYNYIWSAANNSIKLNASTSNLTLVTSMNIYNNTIVDGSFRKKGEVVNSILIDAHASANVYNNIMVGNFAGLNITRSVTSKTKNGVTTTSYTGADTINCHFGNNLTYIPADSLYIYRAGAYSKKQPTDITGTGVSLCNSVFTSWAPPTNVLPDLTVLDLNVPSLSSSSPAIGAGISTLPYPYFITGDGKRGTVDAVNRDLGAYPKDGTGNKHLPTQKPAL
jgi:hypothetical protein